MDYFYDPGHWSNTQYTTYCECGPKYYYSYILQQKTPPNGLMVGGKDYHETLEYNYLKKVVSMVDLGYPELRDFYENEVKTSFKDEVLMTKDDLAVENAKIVLRDKILVSGQEALKVHLREYAPSLQPIKVEERFEVPLGDGLPNLHGIFDLVVLKGIVDHKLSAKSPSDNAAEKSDQLSGYSFAYKKLYGKLPEKLQLQYAIVTKTGNSKAVPLETTRNEGQIERYLKRQKLAIDGIRKGVFVPPSQMSWACDECAYRIYGICNL